MQPLTNFIFESSVNSPLNNSLACFCTYEPGVQWVLGLSSWDAPLVRLLVQRQAPDFGLSVFWFTSPGTLESSYNALVLEAFQNRLFRLLSFFLESSYDILVLEAFQGCPIFFQLLMAGGKVATTFWCWRLFRVALFFDFEKMFFMTWHMLFSSRDIPRLLWKSRLFFAVYTTEKCIQYLFWKNLRELFQN